jgi:hypothetical protein
MVLDPNPGDYGPALKALNPRMRAFVIHYLAAGGRNASEAYRQAGYLCASPDSAKANGWKMLHDAKVQAAIVEETRKRITSGGPCAIETLMELMQSPTVSAKDRIRCAELVANRAGLHATSEHRVTVEHTMDSVAMAEKIRQLAADLGEDANRFLGDQSMAPKALIAVDHDFETDPDDISDIL